jgi:manganese/zinc/iron transport system substrate-binding protein
MLFLAPPLSAQTEPINVVATVGMIANVVEIVGGDHVEVHQLMGPGVDPHLYRATESDIDLLLDAQIIFYNGANLEAKLTDVFEQIGQERPTIAVGESIPEDQILVEEQFDVPDPHIWFDVSLWSIVTETIRDTLIEFDPVNEEAYSENTEVYLEELAELHEYAIEQIASIPEEQRVLITAHDAFHYFARAYDIEVFAPQGITTETEAGVADIRSMIDLIVERNIPAIFVETSVPPDVIDAIIAGVEDAGQEIRIGGQLFSDAMGEPGTDEGTYVGMVKHNVDTIVSALLEEEGA